MKGSDIDTAARQILQDEGVIAHTGPSMLVWINAAQDETVIHAPRANTVTDNIDLVAQEHLQSLPTNCLALVDIIQNMGVSGSTPGKPITRVEMKRLAASRPTWRTDRGTSVRHFMYDERDQFSFYVWPAPLSVLAVEARMAVKPSPIGALSDDLTLADIWKNAMVEYVLHKAYSQNSDSASAPELAMMHYAAFARLVGLKLEKQKKAGPARSSATNPAFPSTEENGAQT